jgi:hypothetical protein
MNEVKKEYVAWTASGGIVTQTYGYATMELPEMDWLAIRTSATEIRLTTTIPLQVTSTY